MSETTATFVDADGWRIYYRRWLPSSEPRGIVQIAHGVAEHSGRYARFAAKLTAAGFAVYANDHRGHGHTAATRDRFGIAGPDGWNAMVRDVHDVTEIARGEFPTLPLFMFAQSIGSLAAQQYLQTWGDDVDGAVLSGTLGALAKLDERLALIEPLVPEHPERPCAVFSSIQASFNKSFEPGPTWLDWLTRDEAEIRAFVADRYCRVSICNQLAAEVLRAAKIVWSPEQESRIPKQLPILMISGSEDAVGEHTANVRDLADRYRRHGMTNVTTKFYSGARHELLHELNHEEVERDVVEWIIRRLQ